MTFLMVSATTPAVTSAGLCGLGAGIVLGQIATIYSPE